MSQDRFMRTAQKAYDLMAEIERDGSGNPTTLEGAIRSVMLKSPDAFHYRDDALGAIYCILGSGIHWHDGRLGDVSPNNYMNMPPQAGGQGCWSLRFGREESLQKIFGDIPVPTDLQEDFDRQDREREGSAIETVEHIDQRCQEYRPVVSWYPISWYACNLCVPAGAQEDFARGALETVQLILASKPTPGTERWIVHQRTRQYAEDILVALIAQFETAGVKG